MGHYRVIEVCDLEPFKKKKKLKLSKISGGSSIHIYNSTLLGNSLSGNSLGIENVAGTVNVESGSERHKLVGEKKITGSLNDSSNHFPEHTDSSENKNDKSESEAIVFELDELKKADRVSIKERVDRKHNLMSRKFKEYQMQLIKNVVNGSIIVLIRPCPYSTFTTYEWDQVVNTNPYAVKKSILTGPLSPSLYEVCSHIAMGLDYNFVSNDESDLDNKASRIFNNLKEKLPLAPKSKITEDEHQFNYPIKSSTI
ncbi:2062_t:CDS:2 [Entrophospora sp. SA101]|nr:2062_t:CDS:2 [Entrophospora sp. SA101]